MGMCSCAHDGFRLLARHVSPGNTQDSTANWVFLMVTNLDVEWEDWRIFTAEERTGEGPPVPHRHRLGASTLLPSYQLEISLLRASPALTLLSGGCVEAMERLDQLCGSIA